MEKMFIYDNGELAEVQAKSFIFELAMEGYIVDNPVLLSNECLDLKDPEVKSVEEPLDSKHRIDVQIQYANDTTAVVELKNVPVDTKALQQLLMRKTVFVCFFMLTLGMLAQTVTFPVYLGGDFSKLPTLEEKDKVFLDDNSQPIGDVLRWVMEEKSFNSIRVRLFVDPSHAPEQYQGWGADQDMPMVKALGKRIKNLGMAFMLDFHYSDTWADPGKQIIPYGWDQLSDEELYVKIYEYTKQSLKELKDAGATPDLIQIGNEISFGMLRGPYCDMNSSDYSWKRFITLLQKASQACREECPEAKIIIHTERLGQRDYLEFFYEKMKQVDYDIIGSSYYRDWHGDMTGLDGSLSMLEEKFSDKDIMIVETNYPYRDNGEMSFEFPMTEQGQDDFTRTLIKILWKHPQVKGLYWWNPEDAWIALWDETGHSLKALSTLKAFLTKQPEGLDNDVTLWYLENPSFSSDLSGWTNTGGTAYWKENTWDILSNYCDFEWTAQPIIDQEVVQFPTLPAGDYRLSADCASDYGSNGLYLIAHDSKLEMTGTGGIGSFSVTFSVPVEGSVKLGFKVENATATWANLDNFKLERVSETAISNISYEYPDARCAYNLAGQRLLKPQKGINIINGRKFVIK